MNLDELTIGEAKELACLSGKKEAIKNIEGQYEHKA